MMMQWSAWDLSEMEDKFCITCMVGCIDAAVVILLNFACRITCGAASWTQAGHFEARSLMRR
jgi:hypothetical protein